MKKKYEAPSMTVLSMNLGENIAASAGKRDEEYEIIITRNGQEVVARNSGFGTLDELLAWVREHFGG